MFNCFKGSGIPAESSAVPVRLSPTTSPEKAKSQSHAKGPLTTAAARSETHSSPAVLPPLVSPPRPQESFSSSSDTQSDPHQVPAASGMAPAAASTTKPSPLSNNSRLAALAARDPGESFLSDPGAKPGQWTPAASSARGSPHAQGAGASRPTTPAQPADDAAAASARGLSVSSSSNNSLPPGEAARGVSADSTSGASVAVPVPARQNPYFMGYESPQQPADSPVQSPLGVAANHNLGKVLKPGVFDAEANGFDYNAPAKEVVPPAAATARAPVQLPVPSPAAVQRKDSEQPISPNARDARPAASSPEAEAMLSTVASRRKSSTLDRSSSGLSDLSDPGEYETYGQLGKSKDEGHSAFPGPGDLDDDGEVMQADSSYNSPRSPAPNGQEPAFVNPMFSAPEDGERLSASSPPQEQAGANTRSNATSGFGAALPPTDAVRLRYGQGAPAWNMDSPEAGRSFGSVSRRAEDTSGPLSATPSQRSVAPAAAEQPTLSSTSLASEASATLSAKPSRILVPSSSAGDSSARASTAPSSVSSRDDPPYIKGTGGAAAAEPAPLSPEVPAAPASTTGVVAQTVLQGDQASTAASSTASLTAAAAVLKDSSMGGDAARSSVVSDEAPPLTVIASHDATRIPAAVESLAVSAPAAPDGDGAAPVAAGSTAPSVHAPASANEERLSRIEAGDAAPPEPAVTAAAPAAFGAPAPMPAGPDAEPSTGANQAQDGASVENGVALPEDAVSPPASAPHIGSTLAISPSAAAVIQADAPPSATNKAPQAGLQPSALPSAAAAVATARSGVEAIAAKKDPAAPAMPPMSPKPTASVPHGLPAANTGAAITPHTVTKFKCVSRPSGLPAFMQPTSASAARVRAAIADEEVEPPGFSRRSRRLSSNSAGPSSRRVSSETGGPSSGEANALAAAEPGHSGAKLAVIKPSGTLRANSAHASPSVPGTPRRATRSVSARVTSAPIARTSPAALPAKALNKPRAASIPTAHPPAAPPSHLPHSTKAGPAAPHVTGHAAPKSHAALKSSKAASGSSATPSGQPAAVKQGGASGGTANGVAASGPAAKAAVAASVAIKDPKPEGGAVVATAAPAPVVQPEMLTATLPTDSASASLDPPLTSGAPAQPATPGPAPSPAAASTPAAATGGPTGGMVRPVWRLVRLKRAMLCDGRNGNAAQETTDGELEVFKCDQELAPGALAAIIAHHYTDGGARQPRTWVFCPDPLCMDSRPTGSALPPAPKKIPLEGGIKITKAEYAQLLDVGLDIAVPAKPPAPATPGAAV